ncbi:hypothetical protein LPTSP3_g34550 [Leptospira kobayashii]|uniref:Tim44-like domain-containing protein n=2 Tax=Leptospira kobayashii TaxID=1917830 RepID=A0ABM7UN39_9LEPT|nr:hypothetical protein LPTSP3_g34550 [Leptospira kobayashii]
MTVLPNTAKVGIVRKKFPVLSNWKIIKSSVIPETYQLSALDWQLDISWPEEINKTATPLEFTYELEKGMDSIGNLSVVYWEINHNSSQINGSGLEISWDPDIHWKSFQLKEKYYDATFSGYITRPVPLIKTENKVSVDFSSLRPDCTALVLTAFPETLPNIGLANEGRNPNAEKDFYTVKQTTYIQKNGINRHEGQIKVFQKSSLEWETPHLEFDTMTHYLGSAGEGSFVSRFFPDYQLVFGVEGDLKTSFWHLFSGQLLSDKSEADNQSRNLKVSNVAFFKLGENMRSSDGKKEIIRFSPFHLSNYSAVKLDSFSLEIVLPEETEEKTNVKLLLTHLNSFSAPIGIMELPAEIEKNKNRFTVNWKATFPEGYLPLIQIETESDAFHTNPFLVYFSALRFFLLAPGSGSNIGYLVFSTLLLTSPFLLTYIFISIAKKKFQILQAKGITVSRIRAGDPDFNEADFFAKSKFIGEKIIESWSAGNMEPVRHFISAGVFQRFQIQLKLLKEVDMNQNLMKDFTIHHQTIIGFDSFADYQTVHMMMSCSAKDITVPISMSNSDIEREFKNANKGNYREVYSFSRKTSAITQIEKDLVHNQCPSCGSDTNTSHITTKCQYCGNIFNSGEYDWVLSEITQEVEWDPNRFVNDKSFAGKYPDCPTSVQLLEDRASALLWKWIYAKSLGDESILKREIANPAILKKTKQKEVFYIPVIGSAEMQNLYKEGNSFRASCHFRWSAARSYNAIPEHKRNVMKLVLNTKRDAKLGFGESSCKNCGAPYPELDAAHCSYCKEPIPETIDDWLLDDIT